MTQELDDPLEPAPWPEQCRRAPSTAKVAGLLTAAALILSYLWSYALTNALVAADVISRWPPGSDPRPLRMCIGFVATMVLFAAAAGAAQWASRRQLKRIDEMELD